jgi:Zn-finger nucleic acid-binding protein
MPARRAIFDAMGLRLLVACAGCDRQYDASASRAGSKYRCSCGSTIAVPEPRPHHAAVVRCSACGAPREAGRTACAYCRADFTLHERDMHTMCARCMARVSDRARFCHHCATPIAPDGVVGGDVTDLACPTCAAPAPLTSRSLGDPPLAVLECPRCAGLWLGQSVLEALVDRTRREGIAPRASLAPAAASDPSTGEPPAGKMYRACPVCRHLMNRRNYGRKSGVIVDACHDHGVWFDATELERILRWIRDGGERRVAALEEEEARAKRRQAETALPVRGVPPEPWPSGEARSPRGGWLGHLAEIAVDLFSLVR